MSAQGRGNCVCGNRSFPAKQDRPQAKNARFSQRGRFAPIFGPSGRVRGKAPLAQNSANRKYLSARPPDAADLTAFYRAAGVRNLPVALALATYINDAGRCDPGQRALSERARAIGQADMPMGISLRDWFSPAMINRRIKALVEAGVITQQHRGPTETCRYQVTARFLPAMRE